MNIRREYPATWRFIQRLADERAIHPEAADGLSSYSLAAFESGEIPERDYRLLLISRHQVMQRERRGRAG